MNDGFMIIMALIIGTVGGVFFIAPLYGSLGTAVQNQITDARAFVNSCESWQKDSAALTEFKNQDFYKENQELKREIESNKAGNTLAVFLWILVLIGFCFISYFFINKYQANKISELQDELQKESDNRASIAKDFNDLASKYSSLQSEIINKKVKR